jgi:HD superfamily phosphohydrolase YqeK
VAILELTGYFLRIIEHLTMCINKDDTQKMFCAALVHNFVKVDDVVTGRYITFMIKVKKESQASYRSEISFYDTGESPYA